MDSSEAFSGRCAGTGHAGCGPVCGRVAAGNLQDPLSILPYWILLVPTVWPVSWRNRNASMGNGITLFIVQGVTKCLDKADFEIGNYWVTDILLRPEAIQHASVNFIYISSLGYI